MKRAGWWRRALAATLVTGQIALAVPSHADWSDTADKLRDTREKLERAADGLATVTRQMGDARGELRGVDARLVAAYRQLADLEERLADAESVVRTAERRTRVATGRLEAETRRLQLAYVKLRRHEELLDNRVAAAYKYGTVSYADALVESHDFTDFLNNVYYVRSALDNDNRLIGETTGLVREIARRRVEVGRLRDEAVQRQNEARGARDDVAALESAQREVTEQLRVEQRKHRRVLRRLEGSQHEYAALVGSLENESAALEEELRAARWEAGAAPGEGQLAWPTTGQPGSGFGYRTHPIFGTKRLHAGVDIAAPTGQDIVAAADGAVVHAGWRGGYGLAVVVAHGGGLATLYGHQSRLAVEPGDVVTQGQVIGHVGSTGYSTGPHLHFEVRVNGVPHDPMEWY